MATDQKQSLAVLMLGAGGGTPGAYLINEAGAAGTLVRVPVQLIKGASVYAVRTAPDGRAIAFGTRHGQVFIVEPIGWGEGSDGMPCFDVGRPVLDLALAGEAVITADDAGRCLLWSKTREASWASSVLAEADAPLCSVTCWGRDGLAALSAAGSLFVWKRLGDEPVHVSAPRLATPVAMTRLCWWAEAGVLVFPTESGKLAWWCVKTHSLGSCPAHQGGFLAIDTLGDELLTIGRRDGLARRWRRPGEQISEAVAPLDVVAVAHVPDDKDQLVLITSSGRAMLASWSVSRLVEQQELLGGGYRSLDSASPDAVRQWRDAQRRERAKDIASRIRSLGDPGSRAELDSLCGELEAIGHSRLAWGLRAEMAARRGDVVEQVAALNQVWQSLAGSSIPELLDRLPMLLVAAGQLEFAAEVGQRLPVSRSGWEPEQWRALREAARDGRVVQQCALPREACCEVAAALQRPLRGRHVIEAERLGVAPGCHLDAAMVAKTYESRRREDAGSRAEACVESVLYLSGDRRPAETDVLGVNVCCGDEQYELMLRFELSGPDTLIHALAVERLSATTDQTAHKSTREGGSLLARLWSGSDGRSLREALQRSITRIRANALGKE